jgi:hypothetical protein
MSVPSQLKSRETRGERPCIPPHLLAALCRKLPPRLRVRTSDRAARWGDVDALAKRMDGHGQ